MLSVLLAALVMGSGAATEPVVVIDRSLKATTGELVSLRDGVAVVSVAGKDVTVTGAAAVVAASVWVPERAWPGLPMDGVSEAEGVSVELTDGTRLRGELLPGKGDGLVLVHKKLGKVEFTLDALRVLTMGSGGEFAPGGAGKGDSVRLLNGDRIEGFVESIGPAKEGGGAGLAVTVEREKVKTVVPLERVAAVSMQGASAKKPERVVWLTGGEKTGATEFSVEKGEARLVRVKGTLAANVKSDQVAGVLMEPGVLTALSACPMRGGGSVETGPEQTLGTRDLTIPEPGQVSWELPKGGVGSRRISGWAVLPEECRKWGDCTVTVAVTAAGQSRELKLVEFTLNSATPVVKIDQELPAPAGAASWLSVTVGEGKNGPVQDRVVLRRVLVGVEPSAAGGAAKPPVNAP